LGTVDAVEVAQSLEELWVVPTPFMSLFSYPLLEYVYRDSDWVCTCAGLSGEDKGVECVMQSLRLWGSVVSESAAEESVPVQQQLI
jgi:hypothetical protein